MNNLNCQQGDLAMVIKGPELWLGKIVQCQKYIGEIPTLPVKFLKNFWRVDQSFPYYFKDTDRVIDLDYCPDEFLKPLRYTDGEDEMVTIAKQKKVPEEVV